MSIAYELEGRTQQKQRTRDALVAAARALVAEGRTPKVEDAAEAAGISRTTAYRYFPNRRVLLFAAHPDSTAESLLPADAPDDPGERLDIVVRSFTRTTLKTEAQSRTMLRLSLQADRDEREPLPLRQGRAIRWIEEALAPLQPRFSAAEVKRLAIAIRSATGIEALVWLTDIAGLSRRDAVALMQWSARAMYAHAVAEHDGPPLSQRG